VIHIGSEEVNSEDLQQLLSMGFEESLAREALLKNVFNLFCCG
jgi:uncharacterized UBP type Zn finger protein